MESHGEEIGKKASEKVERAMHEMKRGELRSGRSGKKVKSRKQAIAIGLSEARKAGGKVPAPPNPRNAHARSSAAAMNKRSGTARRVRHGTQAASVTTAGR